MSFWENLERVDNKTLTTNGCEAYKSTGRYEAALEIINSERYSVIQ